MVYSIAIPVLGQARFLSTALSSLQAQTCRFQLAVMDATPDHSVQDVLENYTEILSYRRHGQDSGQSAAIQEGWDNTDGDIVAWLCADDYYFPYTLEEVNKIFAVHPEIDVVYGDSIFVDREGNFLRYFVEIDDDISAILKRNCISQPSCFVRRSALNRIWKLNSSLHYIMDWDLWVRLYKAGAKFYYLNKPLSAVRMYPETKTASRAKGRYAEINRHLKEHDGFLSRILILLGFYYSDMKMGSNSMFERVILFFLNLLGSIKNVIWKHSKKKNSLFYGFESSSKLVKGECEVVLPFYGKRGPRELVIECRDARRLQVSLNNYMQKHSSVSGCDGIDKYVLEIKEDLISPTLKLNLSSNSTKSWQLLSLKIS